MNKIDKETAIKIEKFANDSFLKNWGDKEYYENMYKHRVDKYLAQYENYRGRRDSVVYILQMMDNHFNKLRN